MISLFIKIALYWHICKTIKLKLQKVARDWVKYLKFPWYHIISWWTWGKQTNSVADVTSKCYHQCDHQTVLWQFHVNQTLVTLLASHNSIYNLVCINIRTKPHNSQIVVKLLRFHLHWLDATGNTLIMGKLSHNINFSFEKYLLMP